jgi:hypothetical protein
MFYIQTKDDKISICCFSAKHASKRRKSKDWLARNRVNMSEWSGKSNVCTVYIYYVLMVVFRSSIFSSLIQKSYVLNHFFFILYLVKYVLYFVYFIRINAFWMSNITFYSWDTNKMTTISQNLCKTRKLNDTMNCTYIKRNI